MQNTQNKLAPKTLPFKVSVNAYLRQQEHFLFLLSLFSVPDRAFETALHKNVFTYTHLATPFVDPIFRSGVCLQYLQMYLGMAHAVQLTSRQIFIHLQSSGMHL